MSFSILGKSIILDPQAAAAAVRALALGTKRQRWSRASDYFYCVWLMEEELVSLHEHLIPPYEDSLCGIEITGMHANADFSKGLTLVADSHESILGFSIELHNVPGKPPQRSNANEIGLFVNISRIPHFGKSHYAVSFILGQKINDAVAEDFTFTLLNAAGVPKDSIIIYDKPESHCKVAKSSGDISYAFHPDCSIPVGKPVLLSSEPEIKLSAFGLSNLTKDQALSCLNSITRKFDVGTFYTERFELNCRLAHWAEIATWTPSCFFGPWIVSLFCQAKERYDANTLIEVTDLGSFVPLDIMGLKGSGLIMCDALRKPSGWELWFHDSEGGSAAKKQKLRDELCRLSGVANLFDRSQVFYNHGNLDF